MNKLLLWLVKTLNPLWKILGVNLVQFYAILDAKLKMDARRKSGMFSGAYSEKSYAGQGLIMVINFLMGAALLLVFFLPHTPTALTIYYAIWMVLLSMTIVMDFSDVLVDTKDNYTLLPTPVKGVTLSTARIMHILLYLFKQAFAFILPGLIYWAINSRAGLLVFIVQGFLAVIMSLCLVTLIYMIAMKISTPQRFKTLINYLQIGFTIGIFGGYYLLPNLFDFSDFENINIFDSPYSYLAPPAWIAAIWEMIFNGKFDTKIIIHVSLAFIMTGGAFIYITKVLSRNFSQNLFSIGQAVGNDEEKKEVKTEKPRRWLDRLADMVTFSKVENAAFKLYYQLTSRNNKFKLKTYPAIGYMPIMFAGMFLQGEGALSERMAQIQAGEHYLFAVYSCVFIGVSPLINAAFSDKPNQVWIFKSTPVVHPKPIFKALFKVIFVKFLIPTWIIMLCISIGFWGVKVVDDFLIGAVVIIFIMLFTYRLSFHSLPFSRPWSEMEGGGTFIGFLAFSIPLAIIGGIHYFFVDNLYVLLGLVFLVVIANFFLWRSFKEWTWKKIDLVLG